MTIKARVTVIYPNPEYNAGDEPFPPVGALGTITSGLDEDGDYDVEFDNYPCPIGQETSWVTHYSMIIFINQLDHIEHVRNKRKLLCQ